MILHGSVKQIAGTNLHHLYCSQRYLCTVCDPQRGLVEDDIHVSHDVIDQSGVADITFDEFNAARIASLREILWATSNEVIYDGNLVCACCKRLVGNVGADEARATANKDVSSS